MNEEADRMLLSVCHDARWKSVHTALDNASDLYAIRDLAFEMFEKDRQSGFRAAVATVLHQLGYPQDDLLIYAVTNPYWTVGEYAYVASKLPDPADKNPEEVGEMEGERA